MKADILRDNFLSFFKSKKHKIVESDSLAPKDDPTVLFTPAGMNQFKKEFLGFDSGFKRAATAQRCLRTDDLDKIGKTCGHHTFFEMLGNFSFGDYFKKEAISFAWEFLTAELKISRDKLWVSVYKDDDEAWGIWRDLIKIPAEKIVRLGDKENFWPAEAKEKGPNGPCGPCSEIFFDWGNDVGCKRSECSPACSCGRFVEVWNLVFTQFNRKEGGVLEPLPKKNIDTGMGLERLAAVMQGVHNNFETDLFQPIVKEITSSLESKVSGQKELIYAIADHIRAVTFSIYDGVLPSNEGRGYVVRKIIRKSALNLKAMGVSKAFLYRLVPVLSEIMKHPYPEIDKRKEDIAEVILTEEKNFFSVLQASGSLLSENFAQFSRDKQNPQEAGKIAFQLYNTYGIPAELTRDWLGRNNIEFSQEAFNREMEEQKNRSKSLSAMKGDVFGVKDIALGVTNSKFLGYKDCQPKAKILKIIQGRAVTRKISQGEEAKIILDQTTFYAESGGQVGDTGELVKGKNVFQVIDTQKSGKVIIHIGRVKQGAFKNNDFVLPKINARRRLSIARNHTATHLLQAALRKVLGAHVKQQGSLVAEDRLRFDFTHFKDIDQGQLVRIEEIVNGYILDNHSLEKKEMPMAQAKKSGALALFGEKYEAKVRVVSIGEVSKELCGGTHLGATAGIGIFKIVQEGSVAAGVRRIEAVTGDFAYQRIKEEEALLNDIASLLNVPNEKVRAELEKRLARIKEIEKQLNAQKLESVKSALDTFIRESEKINGITVIARSIENADMDLLRKTADLIKGKVDSSIITLGTSHAGRALLVMGITADLVQKGLDASKLIREISGILGGSGGGRADFAQAGGSNPENFAKAFQELRAIITKLP